MNKILMGCCLLVFLGCATPYQSGRGAYTGGYFESDAPGKLKKVSFSANGYTPGAMAQKYAIFRSAEYAKTVNKPYFVMYSSLLHASLDKATDTPTLGMVGNKPVAFVFVLPVDKFVPGALQTRSVLDEIQNTAVGINGDGFDSSDSSDSKDDF